MVGDRDHSRRMRVSGWTSNGPCPRPCPVLAPAIPAAEPVLFLRDRYFATLTAAIKTILETLELGYLTANSNQLGASTSAIVEVVSETDS